MTRKEQKLAIAALRRRLKAYQRIGVRVTLAGEEYDLTRIARTCIQEEEDTYMSDYIFDRSGTLLEVRFDKIPIPKN